MSPVAIVTGASKGIGAAIAITLAKEGYNVVVNYNGNQALAEEVKAKCDVFTPSVFVKGNVSKAEDCARIVACAISSFNGLDVLVNNAGITKDNLLLRMSEDEYDAVLDTNLKGTWMMSKKMPYSSNSISRLGTSSSNSKRASPQPNTVLWPQPL